MGIVDAKKLLNGGKIEEEGPVISNVDINIPSNKVESILNDLKNDIRNIGRGKYRDNDELLDYGDVEHDDEDEFPYCLYVLINKYKH